MPLALVVGIAAASWARWYIDLEGMSDDPAPQSLWIWVGLTGLAGAGVLLGWNSATGWRRGVAFVAVPMCVLCTVLALNQWVGYFPTLQTAWNQLTARS